MSDASAVHTGVLEAEMDANADIQEETTVGNCAICLEKPENTVGLPCGHCSCRQCAHRGLEFAVQNGQLPVTCFECDQQFPIDIIHEVLKGDPELIEKHDRLLVTRVIAQDPHARFCPKPGCGFPVICDADRANCPDIVCPACSTLYCYKCRDLAHPDRPCQNALEGVCNVKPCPQCGVMITKVNDGGCNHMHCANCKAEFCWLCGKMLGGFGGLGHFTSMGGCTMFGAKRWSDRKTAIYQATMPLSAPFMIAGIATMATVGVLALPPLIARDEFQRARRQGKGRGASIGTAITGTVITTSIYPVIAAGGVAGLSLKWIAQGYIYFPAKYAAVGAKAAFRRLFRRNRKADNSEAAGDPSRPASSTPDSSDDAGNANGNLHRSEASLQQQTIVLMSDSAVQATSSQT